MRRGSAMIIMALLVCAASSVSAQQYRPVDQAVGDLDNLSVSTRQVQIGLQNFGEQTALYRIDPQADGGPNMQPVYMRVGPGYSAQLSRMDYVVPSNDNQLKINAAPTQDGRYLELVPPNTVFILSPRNELPAVSEIEDDPTDARIDGRIDRRIDRQINTMIDGRVDGRVVSRADGVSGGRPGWYQSRTMSHHRSYAPRPIVSPSTRLSINRTEPTLPATSATTPPVSAGSTESR